jgi:hypothetical protein
MDVYEIPDDDGDPRNARVRVIRHPAALRPGTYPAHQRPFYAAPTYPAQAPMYPASAPMYPAPMIVQRPRRIADLPTGEVLALAAQAFAALQALPAAPVAVGSAETDGGNLIVYQAALATHAKRDEQLRTAGALIAKLLG